MEKWRQEPLRYQKETTDRQLPHGDEIEEIRRLEDAQRFVPEQEHTILYANLQSDQPQMKEAGLKALSAWVTEIQSKYQAYTSTRHRKEMMRKITMSEDFAAGKLMVHQTQIEYIQELLTVVDDPHLKEKLEKQLLLIRHSFASLQYIREFTIHTKARYSWREPTRWLEKLLWSGASGVGTTTLGVTLGGIMQMINTGNFYTAAAALFGAGVGLQLVFGEINMFQKMRPLNKQMKKMLDLSNTDPDELSRELDNWQQEFEDRIKILEARTKAIREINDSVGARREL